MPHRVLLAVLGAFALIAPAHAAETPLSRYETVEIEPAKTSIYIGTVTMTLPPFARKDGVYYSTYSAKVFPYFFYNEKGKIGIPVSDEMLRRLERGESVDFKASGLNEEGEERRIEGRAVPTDATKGKIKVRIFVSKKIELIFNTTYRFAPKP
jgi:hypothetical protein